MSLSARQKAALKHAVEELTAKGNPRTCHPTVGKTWRSPAFAGRADPPSE